jgi:hypothetical protein
MSIEKRVNHVVQLIINLPDEALLKFAERETAYKKRNQIIIKLLLIIKKLI